MDSDQRQSKSSTRRPDDSSSTGAPGATWARSDDGTWIVTLPKPKGFDPSALCRKSYRCSVKPFTSLDGEELLYLTLEPGGPETPSKAQAKPKIGGLLALSTRQYSDACPNAGECTWSYQSDSGYDVANCTRCGRIISTRGGAR